MEFSARGLVLAERTVGEWDKSLTLLCEGIGKISVWARGAKRVKSPLLAACSMFVLGSYSFVKKGERISVTSAQPEETFFGLRTDVEGLSLAAYLCELCRTLCAEQQPEDELLSLTLNALYALSEKRAPAEVVKPAFELRSLAQSGFCPRLGAAAWCAVSGNFPCIFPRRPAVFCAPATVRHKGTHRRFPRRCCRPCSTSVAVKPKGFTRFACPLRPLTSFRTTAKPM